MFIKPTASEVKMNFRDSVCPLKYKISTLNYNSNTVEFDSNAGVATVMSNPLTIIGL